MPSRSPSTFTGIVLPHLASQAFAHSLLELTDPGFNYSVLSEFRTRLLESEQGERLLTALLQECQARGYIRARGKQRTDSTHVLAAIRTINRLECAGETLRAALNAASGRGTRLAAQPGASGVA